jgi:hypothetical protein
MMCLAKDRKRRYDTANGLAQDIRRYLEYEIITARPPPATSSASSSAATNSPSPPAPPSRYHSSPVSRWKSFPAKGVSS